MICNFKLPDGTWNLAGPPDAGGRVRIQCTACGRVYPKASRNPLPMPGANIEYKTFSKCPGSPAARALVKDKKSCAACPENSLDRAGRAYQSLLDNFAKALAKADDTLRAAITDELNRMIEPDIPRLKKLAVQQALREGKAHDPGNEIEGGAEGRPTGPAASSPTADQSNPV